MEARLLLGLLPKMFTPRGPVHLDVDDTIERRRGKRISAKDIYCDPARASRPRTKGIRLPNLARVPVDASIRWQSITVSGWYGTP